MLPEKTIHFVDGRQLCDQQYQSHLRSDSFGRGRKVGIKEEQKRMTKALRELHKQGWTLSDVIEAEDTMGEVEGLEG